MHLTQTRTRRENDEEDKDKEDEDKEDEDKENEDVEHKRLMGSNSACTSLKLGLGRRRRFKFLLLLSFFEHLFNIPVVPYTCLNVMQTSHKNAVLGPH